MTHHFMTADGRTCCRGDYLCEHCRAAADEMNEDYAPPSPYRSLMAPRVEVPLDDYDPPDTYGLRKKEGR